MWDRLSRWPDRLLALAMLGPCWGVFLLAMVWPAVALVAKSIAQGEPPVGGFTFSGRQLGLLWRSCWLAATATAACLIVALPGVYVIGHTRRLAHRPAVAALLMALLLCPPMVYAFGWERLLPVTFDPSARCVGVWALWAWPIPALVIGTGWSRVGREVYEAALTTASETAAFLRIALPLMLKYVGLSALILFVLFLGDYGVPHACGLRTYATELLGWAASSSRTIDTAWPASLTAAVTGAALVGVFVLWTRCVRSEEAERGARRSGATSPIPLLLAAGVFAVSGLLPVGTLVIKLASAEAMGEALAVYGKDLAWSVGVALASGVLVMAMGLGLAASRRLRTGALVWSVVFGALPGALIGETLIAAYNHEALWWLYDHWPIVALSYVSRFGWLGVLTALVVAPGPKSELGAQAATDGATTLDAFARIHLPMNWPTLLCGVAVIAALSIADTTACSLVRVPTYAPISLILLDQFHYHEDGMLVSLSLWLIATSLPGVVLIIPALKRSGDKKRQKGGGKSSAPC